MKAKALKSERIGEFIAYCKKHRQEVDESFLYDEDLKEFEPNDENPTYIISDTNGEIIAAVSLIMTDYFRRGRKARFRIFHSKIKDIDCYKSLMQALLSHTEGLDKVFIFIPTTDKIGMEFMEELYFTVERHAFLLVRENLEVQDYNLPEDYVIRSFRPGNDEEIWCEIRNASFAKLKGSETPIIPEMVTKMILSEEYIEGGMMILFHKDKPVGIVRGALDEYEDEPIMNIGPLAIIPEYQGRGLGRVLLRASLHFAEEKSFKRTILSVNGENERAKALYIQEGFKQVEAVTCYEYHLNS
ncbi:GNAT family N-acetyltransferase [Cytobacillus dafuensis]|uniref:GNAT family N-acetyltransferase n=1 Tax=Cytobacillus dafuensis TaxID=1742359 RepID=A0A5B8Z9Q3_CYTDA|nr:GNAT family N-acetyltransferase [Cytobacillus dafuensis]QED49875.1 GNAT family N-acetyltransferase [Cytobacillus dafuensis]